MAKTTTVNKIVRELRKILTDDEMACLEFNRGEIEVCVGYAVNDNGYGYCDDEATEALVNKIKAVFNWGGFSTGYGAWCMREHHQFTSHDYCDVANPRHY